MPEEDTPPSSPALELANEGDDEELVEVDEDELVEVLEGHGGPSNDSGDEDEGEPPADFYEPELGPTPERDDASFVFSKHKGIYLRSKFHVQVLLEEPYFLSTVCFNLSHFHACLIFTMFLL